MSHCIALRITVTDFDAVSAGLDELFASMTAQLVLRRRQITMEHLRKQRESVYLGAVPDNKGKSATGKHVSNGGCC